jgi:CheY-like chemotaxis protein
MEMSGLRILVADDHEGIRDCIVRVLRMEYDVIAAVSDGDELVTAAIDLEPDVIVSDVCMPGVSGIEAQKRLQQQGVEIPFVFVSASPDLMQNITRSRGVCIAKTDVLSVLNAEVRRVVRLQAARAQVRDLPTRYEAAGQLS